MLSSSYNIPSIKLWQAGVYQQCSRAAAARGAGPPQANFALESAIDMLAEKMGIDPLEFRRMNSLKPGQPFHRRIVEQWEFPEICDADPAPLGPGQEGSRRLQ